MDFVAHCVGVFFLFLFLWVGGLNGWNFVNGLRGRKTASYIPLVGGICGILGLGSIGPWARHWVWLPLVLDFGTIPLFAWTTFFYLFILPFKRKPPLQK